MENSDPEEEEEDAAAEKLLDDEYNKVADKKEDTDFRKNEDRLVDDADDDDVDAALVVVLAATVFTANIVLFPSSTSDVNSRAFPYTYTFSPKRSLYKFVGCTLFVDSLRIKKETAFPEKKKELRARAALKSTK